jgi:hypothetical protein
MKVIHRYQCILFMMVLVVSGKQIAPDMAVNRRGEIVVVWSDGQDVWASYFQENLENRIHYVIVSEKTGQNTNPSVALDDQGRIIIVWENIIRNNIRIFMRLFQPGLQEPGLIASVVDEDSLSNQTFPEVALNNSGEALIVWVDYRHQNADIYGRLFRMRSGDFSPEFRINDDPENAMQNYPGVEAGKNRFVVVWEDHREPYAFIYGQVIDKKGKRRGPNFRVNETEYGSSWQAFASVGISNSGAFVVVWKDYRNGDSDIYAQRFNKKQKRVGSNFRVNDDQGPGWQRLPAIRMTLKDEFMMVWEDYRQDSVNNQKGDIYGQYFNKSAMPYGVNILINRSAEPTSQIHPLLGILPDDDAVILWEDYHSADCALYYQYLSKVVHPSNKLCW